MLGAAATCWPGVLAQGASGHDGLTRTEPCRVPGFPVTLDMHAMPRCPVSQHSAHSRDWPRNRCPRADSALCPPAWSCCAPPGVPPPWRTRGRTPFFMRGEPTCPGGGPWGRSSLPVWPPHAPADAVLTLVTRLRVSRWELGGTTQSSLCVNLWLIKPQLTKVQFLPRHSSPRQGPPRHP